MVGSESITFVPSAALYPFAPHWFETRAGRMHYIDEGTGDPILFIHGNPTWSFLYRHIVLGLRDHYRCIAVDLLGFGLSDRPDDARFHYTPPEHTHIISALIKSLDLRNLVIMGQDWGGPIGLGAALEHRERLRGLVMGNTWYWPVEDKVFSMAMKSAPVQWLITEQNFFIERLISAGLGNQIDADEMAHYREVFPTAESREGVATFARQNSGAAPWLTYLRDHVTTELRDVPLLMPWGLHDPLFPLAAAARFRRPFREARFVALPKAHHFIQEDAPGEIVAAIASWLLEQRS